MTLKKNTEEFKKNIENWSFNKDSKIKKYLRPKTKYMEIFENLPIAYGKGTLGHIYSKCTSKLKTSSYFIMKKTYCYTNEKGKFVCKMKGVPEKTIADDGSKIQVLNEEAYKRLHEGENVEFTFKTLKKEYKNNFNILAYEMVRKIKKINN